MPPAEAARTGNILLDSLPGDERARIVSSATMVELGRGKVLHEQGEPQRTVYFPLSGVASLVTLTSTGTTVELATAGREGMVGVSLALGTDRWHNNQTIVQVPGTGLELPAEAFLEQFEASPDLARYVYRYVQALLVQIAQSVACNRMHQTEQRAARWLLQTHDRVGDDDLQLTHEFLAAMLGVRRASVTVAAKGLRDQGLVDYRRGKVRILDRAGLEAASCECYKVVREEFERLLPPLDIPS